jgi:hypothetical protein
VLDVFSDVLKECTASLFSRTESGLGGGGVPVMNRMNEFQGVWTGVSGELQSSCFKGYQWECIGGGMCVVIF